MPVVEGTFSPKRNRTAHGVFFASVTTGTETSWHPREPRPDDRAALTAVFNAAFHRADTPALLDWRYEGNPHGAARTILAAGPDDSVAGAYSYVPRKFNILGNVVTVMQASDAMVFEHWQRKGIFTGLDQILAERAVADGVPFGFAFCGRRSQKGFLANGWKPIAPYRTWTRILKVTKTAREARGSDGRLRQWMIPIEWLRAKSSDPVIAASLGGFRDEEARDFHTLHKIIQQFARHAICGERDLQYLQWRFVATPRRTHRPYVLFRGAEPAGYYDVECSDRGRGYLLDARAVDPAAEDACLAAAVMRLRALGASTIQTTVVDGSFLARKVARLGFFPPRDRAPLPFIVRVFTDGPEARAALDPANWYIFDGDRDAESMI